ncbi:MAG TPA: hypothetical protein VNJ10_09970 [Sphingomonas sp.]|nr:hypothetical protein [Sphingomonas sp.]
MNVPDRRTLLRALPLYGAVAGGVIAAAGVLLIPTDTLETLVWSTGIAALVPGAAPPLGTTARVLLSVGSGLLVSALLWSSLFLLFGPGGFLVRRAPRADGVPMIRRADAHPDAPPRKPMTAADLGTPMMEVGVGQDAVSGGDARPIPVDLDQPLAAFDPRAILPVPMEPIRPVSPLAQAMTAPVIEIAGTAEATTYVTAAVPPVATPTPADPVEVPIQDVAEAVDETPAPTPLVRAPRLPVEPAAPPTIEALLSRLEQGAVRRGWIGSH